MDMNTAIICEAVDDAKVERCLSIATVGLQKFSDTRKQIVTMMAAMNATERGRVERQLLKIKWPQDLLLRMVACASRGIVNAGHLFDVIRRTTHLSIELASGDALRQIANPDYEFVFVDDDGKSMLITSCKLSSRTVSKVWHYEDGAISEKTQRTKMIKIARGETIKASNAANAKIISRILVTNDGPPKWEITYRYEGAAESDTHIVRFDAKQIKSLAGG